MQKATEADRDQVACPALWCKTENIYSALTIASRLLQGHQPTLTPQSLGVLLRAIKPGKKKKKAETNERERQQYLQVLFYTKKSLH